jgi:hypothetical protein
VTPRLKTAIYNQKRFIRQALGGKRISTILGDLYNQWLKRAVGTTKGAADLCAYFYLRAVALLRKHGSLGLLATNTICQGDTCDVGLAQIVKSASINPVIYGDGDPVDNNDPSGHYSSYSSSYTSYSLVGGVGGVFGDSGDSGWENMASSAGAIFAGVGGLIGSEALAPILGGIAAFNGIIGGLNNESAVGSNVSSLGAFGVGFAGSFTSSVLSDVGLPCWVASGIGGAITSVGDDYLNNPNNFNLTSALEDVATGALGGILMGGYCFVAGTPVLVGDRKTHVAIESIRVCQRVATDGGVSNSADGKTKAADPNATAVDPRSWRKLTIRAGKWEVQTLRPVGWLDANNVSSGASIRLASVVDLGEMPQAADLAGAVESIEPCPAIAAGPGRVVLTTVSHVDDFVFDLTLTNASGRTEAVGVTGGHRYYDPVAGWTQVKDLQPGQVLRGDRGDLTVLALARRSGSQRVFNMAVEADHVYYVGGFGALVHNGCDEEEPYVVQTGGNTATNALAKALNVTKDVLRQAIHDFKDEFDIPGDNQNLKFLSNGDVHDENWNFLDNLFNYILKGKK